MAGESIWRRPAPTSLKLIAGAVIFPMLWLGIGLICGELLKGSVGPPIPPWLLIAAAVAGALASFLLVRKASLPVAVILVALPMLAYLWTYYGLERMGNAGKPFGTATEQAPPAEPEMAPSMAEPSGGGGGPHYETETPATPEAVPPPPAAADGATQLGTEDEMAAPQPQPAPPAAADGGTYHEEWVPPESQAAPPTAEDGEVIVGGHQREPLPEFPWPPPQASASYVLPDRLLANYHTVGDVTGAIIGALEQSGYVERSFFQTRGGGVALVTRLERINDDGTSSADAERWPNGGQYSASKEGLLQFLEGLFYVDPGHYRVIVFVLQDMPFSQSATSVTGEEARAWLRSGANVLPPDIAGRPFGGADGGHCTALIYEFASDGTKVHVVESRLTGKQHLEKAGVLAGLGPSH